MQSAQAGVLTLDNASGATRLLERRRQMFSVQEQLEQQKEAFRQQEGLFKKREVELGRKDLELQDNLVRFSKFLQEKDSQRLRAERKANEQIKERLEKEKAIEEMKQRLEELQFQVKRRSVDVVSSQRYKDFLDTVVEQSADEYREIGEVTSRYETLKTLRQDNESRLQTFIEGNEEYKQQLVKFKHQKEAEMMELNNDATKLKEKAESVRSSNIALQKQTEANSKYAQSRTLKLGLIKMACDNIFERIQSSSTLGRRNKEDSILRILEVSGDYIKDLIDICKEKEAEIGEENMPSTWQSWSKQRREDVAHHGDGDEEEEEEEEEEEGEP